MAPASWSSVFLYYPRAERSIFILPLPGALMKPTGASGQSETWLDVKGHVAVRGDSEALCLPGCLAEC